jgi:quercetin dioxygenase-like cupin family protein
MKIDWKLPLVAAVGMAFGAVGGISFAKDEAKKAEYTLVPAGTQKWNPMDPKNPKGIQMSVISGDPKTGPVAFMLKLPKGGGTPHWHSSDYYAVVVEGNARHWLDGKQKEAKDLKPGSSWYQPGGSDKTMHGDECMSESCLAFVVMTGKLDAQFPTPPAKK